MSLTPPCSRGSAGEQRLGKDYYLKKTLENLIATGLVKPDSVIKSRDENRRGKAAATGDRASKSNSSSGGDELPVPVKSSRFEAPAEQLILDQRGSHDTTGTTLVLHAHASSADIDQTPSAAYHPLPSASGDMAPARAVNRRERTFIGSSCAACEEPLEHILRGERVLQLSCGHVFHEACFYEYIKDFEEQTCPSCDQPLALDTTKGGNLNFEHLNKLARASNRTRDRNDRRGRSESPPAHPRECGLARHSSTAGHPPGRRPSRDHGFPEGRRHSEQYDSYTIPLYEHTRSASDDTGTSSGYDRPDSHGGWRHEYDVQSMEASVPNPRQMGRTPILPPLITVRSEFPTLNRSRQQQSLTCLVTVEVVEGKWQATPSDMQISSPRPVSKREEAFELPSSPPARRRPFAPSPATPSRQEDANLRQLKENLFRRVDEWYGLDTSNFGTLLLHEVVRVGKDRQTWQELECFLFSQMLICVKEKKVASPGRGPQETRCALKGSILIKKHLERLESSADQNILTLSLSVLELPAFHLLFQTSAQMENWRSALIEINQPQPSPEEDIDDDASDEQDTMSRHNRRVSSYQSSYGNRSSQVTAPTEYTNSRADFPASRASLSTLHVPLDIVVVVPVTPSVQGLKVTLLRDMLRFLVANLGERDRMGLVTFGSGSGAAPLVGMTTKNWDGWKRAIDSVRPLGLKSMRSDIVDGANVAVDMLMQRRAWNPLSHILLISDSPTSDADSVDFVVSRAEAAKIAIYSFGLGLTHKPDALVAMSTRTKASYTYVKDWMMLRDSVAGCLGALQSISHQNVKVKLRLPEGSPAKFVKISGAIHTTKRATGRDAEASLGDLRFGDKRDILVQLAIQPDSSTPVTVPADPWESMISGLEAISPMEQDDTRMTSVEELPLLQADIAWGDILQDGNLAQLPHPSLLAITMLPALSKSAASSAAPSSLPIPPHPSIVQRRMELLTSDMLSRALSLVARGQNDRAQHLLTETRSILKGLSKGGLPPLPTPPPTAGLPPTPTTPRPATESAKDLPREVNFPVPPSSRSVPSSPRTSFRDMSTPFHSGAGIDYSTISALDAELATSLEWICHPTVFGRDTRKAVLQAVGVINSQRGYTYRSSSESLWAQRIPGIRRLTGRSRQWREIGNEALVEVSEPATSTTTATPPY